MRKIIVDISNLLHASYIGTFMSSKNNSIPDDIKAMTVKEYVLRKILIQIKRFDVSKEDVILAMDFGSWRKDHFPHYKHKRRASQDDDFRRKMIDFFNDFESEILANLPWKTIKIGGVEGDDIIGVLTRRFQEEGATTFILSRDHDFLQLVDENTKIIDPFNGNLIACYNFYKEKDGTHFSWDVDNKKDAKKFLLFHILLGDPGDGIPSVVLDDDHYTSSKKGKRFGVKTILNTFFSDNEEKNVTNLKKCHHENQKNFYRNMLLIDLNNIPFSIRDKINSTYNEEMSYDFQAFENWCASNNLYDILKQFEQVNHV